MKSKYWQLYLICFTIINIFFKKARKFNKTMNKLKDGKKHGYWEENGENGSIYYIDI